MRVRGKVISVILIFLMTYMAGSVTYSFVIWDWAFMSPGDWHIKWRALYLYASALVSALFLYAVH